MPPSSVKAEQKHKLKLTQRIKVSAPTTSGTNERSNRKPIPNKHANVSPMAGAGRKRKIVKSETSLKDASIRKRHCSGYVTLLDANMMNTAALRPSTVVPTEELIPNSYHQKFHIARWTAWLRETPTWIINLGRESIYELNGRNGHPIPKNIPSYSNMVQMCKSRKDTEVKVLEDKRNLMEQDGEMKENLTEWRDWSLQLTDNNRLLITGKTTLNTVGVSRDVSFCERIDANTLLHSDGSVYILNGMPDHFTNLPYFVRNKFQCGFPDDWKEVRCKWMEYIRQGSPFDFTWTIQTDKQVLGAAAIEGSTEKDIVWQNETFIISSSPIMSDTSQHGVPVNRKEAEQAHSMAVQDEEKQFNSDEKEPQFAVNQEIVLEKWTPILVNGCEMKITGYIKSERHTEVSHTTGILEKRKACDSVQSKNGQSYRLIGTLADPNNTVPSEIKKKLSKGLPVKWKALVKTWASIVLAMEK